jgi:hypothetical protein
LHLRRLPRLRWSSLRQLPNLCQPWRLAASLSYSERDL